MSSTFLDEITDRPLAQSQSGFRKAHLVGLGLIALITWGTVLLGRGLVPTIVLDYYFELPIRPYLVLNDAARLYFGTPFIITAGILAWFLPGIFLTLLVGKTQRYSELVIWAFGFSYLIYILMVTLIKLFTPGIPSPNIYLAGLALAGAVGWVSLAVLVFKGKKRSWPVIDPVDKRRLLWTIVIPLIALLLLFPVIFWQDMHGDAVEALELGRSLYQSIWPRFPSPQGVAGLGIGMAPMAFPVHWFIVLFGEIEAAARLPYILYLPVIFCLLLEMMEWQSPRRMMGIEESLLLLALAIVTVTLSYNASYDPYFSDIASPMAIDFFEIIAILAAIYFLWRQNWFFLTFWVLVAFLGRPTGIFLLGLMTMGVFLFFPEKRKNWLPVLFALIMCCLALGLLYDKVLLPALSGTMDYGYHSESIIDRIRYIRLFELLRLNFGIFPVGILPFLALLFFNWQDRYARLVSFITLGYYFIFLFVAFTALHHFIPVMILPLIVFWRMVLFHPEWNKKLLYSVVAVAGIFSLVLSLPRTFVINRTVRSIGQKTMVSLGSYDTGYQKLIRHTNLFTKLVRPDWSIENPAKEFESTPLALIYYGTRQKQSGSSINYILQDLSAAVPPGYLLAATDQAAGLLVGDKAEWQADRFQDWNINFRSPLYAIPRGTLYYYRVETEGTKVVDLIEVAGKIKHSILGDSHN